MNISSIESSLAKCDNEINDLIKKIDSTMDSLQEKTVTTTASSIPKVGSSVLNNKAFVKLNYSGSTFNVVNTPNISVVDLVNFIDKYKLSQTYYPRHYNNCLGIAKAYGRSLMTGNLPKNIDDFYGGAYTYFDRGTGSPNKEDILKMVYNQLIQGKPCVIQVTTKAGNRHYATVVGMKENVTSAKDLKEEDLLIIDAWDGRLEAMDDSITADRHMHKEDGKYRIDVLTI